MFASGSRIEFPPLQSHSDAGAAASGECSSHEADTAPWQDAAPRRRPLWRPLHVAGPAPLLRLQRAPHARAGARASNARIVDAFAAGACKGDSVLRMTVANISRDGTQTADARACFEELDQAVDRQTGERVRPNVFVYNALISAHERAGELTEAARYLEDAVERGVLLPTLGYDPTRNELDLHRYAVEQGAESKMEGINADVARGIFRRLHGQGLLNERTEFIVGSHGTFKVSEAIRDCMVEVGWPPRHPAHKKSGRPNEGRWVVDHGLLR